MPCCNAALTELNDERRAASDFERLCTLFERQLALHLFGQTQILEKTPHCGRSVGLHPMRQSDSDYLISLRG